MYFVDGSVVQRLPLELTASGQGQNCEAINSRLLDCVNGRIEPRLGTMRSCVANILTDAVSFRCSVRNRVKIPSLYENNFDPKPDPTRT